VYFGSNFVLCHSKLVSFCQKTSCCISFKEVLSASINISISIELPGESNEMSLKFE